MSHKPNTALIDFLTNSKNLSATLEVIAQADEVRAVVLSRFWTTLDAQLRSGRPVEIQKAKPFWTNDLASERLADKHIGIGLHLESSQDQQQALCFQIGQDAGPKYYDLYFGLHWTQRIEGNSTVLANRKLASLKEHLQKYEFRFDDQNEWYGWKYLKRYANRDDFLSEFSEKPKLILDAMSQSFWQYVSQIYTLVIKANASIR